MGSREETALPPTNPVTAKAREREAANVGAQVPAARDPAWGARVVIVGLVSIVGALALAVVFFDDAKDVIAITGPAFAVVSGLVAAYFGIRAGSLASERVQGAAAGHAPPGMSEKQQEKHLKNGAGG
jgi:hypothetical protein